MQPTPEQVAAEVQALAAGMAAEDDVTALGELITERLGPVDPLRILRRRDDPVRDVLESLASRAAAEDPAQRPTPAEFVIALASHQRGPSSPRRHRVIGAAAVIAAVAVLATVAWASVPRHHAATTRSLSIQPAPTTTVDTEPATTTSTTEPVATRVWPPAPTSYADGVLEFDGHRYAVGQPGDVVVVSDWGCRGSPAAALLRPSTGEVFVFTGWATPDADVTAERLTVVAEATGLAAEDTDGDGCSELVARHADGSRSTIELEA